MFEPQTPKQPSEDAIIVENVSKHFRIPHEKKTTLFEHILGTIKGGESTHEEFWALKNVSFKVNKGETLGIIGENGAGKSTLLKIIAGVFSPDSGSVTVNGKIAPFLELGVGFQPELTAEDNVRLYGAIMGMTKQGMESKFEGIFEFAELQRFRNMKLKNFSSGMYARLAFATATATEPDILLIDEVLAVGDAAFRKKCYDRMKEYRKSGKTFILVSHDMGAIRDNCSRTIFLHKGVKTKEGDSNSVIDSYSNYSSQSKLIKSKISIECLKPSDELKIIDARIIDVSGNERNTFKTGEKSIIKIAYEAKSRISSPFIGIGIFRDDGLRVHSTNIISDNLGQKYLKGEGEVEIVYENLTLLNGNYNIDITICFNNQWDRVLL